MKQEELSLEEIHKIVEAFLRLCIGRIRITGGEPLVRPDLTEIIKDIHTQNSKVKIGITTNGHGFAKRAEDFYNAGLKSVNFSLDSLDPVKYSELTGGGDLKEVQSGIETALKIGYEKVKINVVLMKGRNEDEAEQFLELAKYNPVEVRFIELMPLGRYGREDKNRLSCDTLLARYPSLKPVQPQYLGQPSKDYAGEGFKGKVGFISPMSHEFCSDCNRARVTSDGKLRLCLGSNKEIDMREYLTEDSASLCKRIEKWIYEKPKCHSFHETTEFERHMNQIGG